MPIKQKITIKMPKKYERYQKSHTKYCNVDTHNESGYSINNDGETGWKIEFVTEKKCT